MNKKGSAIIWVVSTLLIFMIVVTGIMSLVGSSHRNALRNNYKQQAYFTALSAVRIVAIAINSDDSELIIPEVGHHTELSIDLSDKAMGYADVSVRREIEEEIILMGVGNYLEVKDRVNLRLYYLEDDESWEVFRYER